MKLIILSSTNIGSLELEAAKYEIHQVGSLSVSNGQFFLAALGELKVGAPVPVQLELPLEPEVSKSTAKRLSVQKKVT